VGIDRDGADEIGEGDVLARRVGDRDVPRSEDQARRDPLEN
jgi:hypothetical protein